LRDIYIARSLYRLLDASRQPLNPAILTYAEQQVKTSDALSAVKTLNDKYVAIQNTDISKLTILKSNDDVADMSDGEKILRKIIEPYKGRVILLDIWGTWCGPCKEALSHSTEEYERLKDIDMVFLYLANRSPQTAWENVIKEYNVSGPNVAHYNLPSAQQDAIERHLNVHSFPTYKLFNRNGELLDIKVDPFHLEELARLLQQMK
jgi:thiol-disulfide isomerase/thioredoxin